MPANKTLTFSGINAPNAANGFPYDVNRSFQVNKNGERIATQPDENGIIANVNYAPGHRLYYWLTRTSDDNSHEIFLAFGDPPYTNLSIQNAEQYGGTATVT